MTNRRDSALDLLRGLAIGRVFLWHATGWAALTWIGALPVMFAVTGYLLAAGAARNGMRRTLVDRSKRLLLPYWFFAAVMLSVMYLVEPGAGFPTPADLVGWVLPVVDPVGAQWQQGWITEPLWYLRTYTWLLIAAPLLVAAVRRRPVVVLAVLAGAVPVAEAALGVRGWAFQDFLTYGFFFTGGAGVASGVVRFEGRRASLLAVVGGVAAVVLYVVSPPQSGVVNNSHTLHLLVGLLWLGAAAANLPRLRRMADSDLLARPVSVLTRHSLSVYLWHAPVIGLSYLLVGRTGLGNGLTTPVAVALAIVGTALVAGVVGGIEASAGGRASRLLPTRRALTGLTAAGVIAGALLTLPTPGALVLPPTPSKAPAPVDLTENEALAFLLAPETNAPGQPLGGDGASGTSTTATPTTGAPTAGAPAAGTPTTVRDRADRIRPDRSPVSTAPVTTPVTTPIATPPVARRTTPVAAWNDLAPAAGDDLRNAVLWAAGEWVRQQNNERQVVYETGIEIAVVQPGRMRIVTRIDRNGDAAEVGESIPFASITKSFTAALLLRAVEDGRIRLEDPIGTLAVAPWFTLTQDLTLKDLLAHRSGIVPYTSFLEWKKDWQLFDGWEPVLRAAEEEGRSFTPGTKVEYSSTNYVIAGLLAAQIYGTPIEKLIQEQLLAPLGLDRTRVGMPIPGAPGTGTGNMSGHVTDLARWGVAMWRDRTVLGAVGNSMASYTDPVQLIGYGGFSYCPCTSSKGRLVVAGIGANGAEATVRYYAATDTVIAIRIPNGLTASLEDLITSILTLTR